jgi:hypothetical protein
MLDVLQAMDVDVPNPATLDPKTLEEAVRKAEEMIAQIDFPKQLDLLDRFYLAAARASGATSSQRQKAFADAEQIIEEAKRNKDFVSLLLPVMPHVLEAVTRGNTYHRGTKCLIALRRWQLEQNTPPPDLATVVKAAGMEGVPIDPYSDQPLRMTVLAGQPVIYSVGKDGRDDGAQLEWDLNMDNPQGDILFRLAPPP